MLAFSPRKVAFHPTPKSLLKGSRLLFAELLGDLLPSVALPQHLENLPDLPVLILFDSALDQIE